jgi:hypothetical protein
MLANVTLFTLPVWQKEQGAAANVSQFFLGIVCNFLTSKILATVSFFVIAVVVEEGEESLARMQACPTDERVIY